MPVKCKNDVQAYIDGVLSGEIIACKYVKLAVQRHLKDLKTGRERGLYFDPKTAQLVIDFFSLLQHTRGEWAGKEFILAGWQLFIVWALFGWKKADGSRRFRISYSEVARKNGKTVFAAGIGLYLLLMDGEIGAEIFSAATKLDQARIIHQEAIRMVRQSQSLKQRAKICINNIHVVETGSKFEPLGADAKTLDGLNPSGATIDELHAHPDSSVWDVLRSAMGARRQPLLFAITTAGFNTQSFCYQQRDYAIKVLEGVIEDDSFFAIIFTLDEKDDWKNENVWLKANPNLGVCVDIEDMRDMCKEAIESPGKLNNFLCKKLNVWTTQKVRWVNPEKWNACNAQINESSLVGKPCYAGLDLSSNTDITAFVMLFPLDALLLSTGRLTAESQGQFVVVPRFWIPKEKARERERRDRVPYLTWAQQGFIKLTEGNVVDYAVIQADVFEDFGKFDVQGIAFDRWNFEAIRQRLLSEGVNENKMIAFGQGYASMSAPMKELEKLYLGRQLVHNNNPVLKWMADNVMTRTDPAGNIKPDKEKSSEKIDGIVALIMALGLALTKPQTIDKNANLLEVGI